MSNNVIINISKDFTQFPGARYVTDGKFSGEEFYETILKPKVESVWNNQNATITIDFDGTYGFASSFISEIAIRLVNDFKDKKKIYKKIIFKSEEDPLLIDSLKTNIDETDIA